MLDDRDLALEQQRVHRPVAARRRRVDVDRVDADQDRAVVGQPGGGVGRQERVLRGAVLLGAEVRVPAGADQHRGARDVEPVERGEARPPRSPGPVDDDGRQEGALLEGQPAEVVAVAVPVAGGVEVGPGVGDHLDPADGELGALGVHLVRVLEGQVVRDHRRGQAGVGDQPVGDGVAEVDEAHGADPLRASQGLAQRPPDRSGARARSPARRSRRRRAGRWSAARRRSGISAAANAARIITTPMTAKPTV